MVRTEARWRPAIGVRAGLLLPVLLVFAALLVVPFVMLVPASLHPQQAVGGVGRGFSLHNYAHFVSDRSFRTVLWRTLTLSFLVTPLDLVIGYPVAYVMARRPGTRLTSLLYIVIVSPLLISLVVRTFGWIIILERPGLLNAVLGGLHLPRLNLLYTDAAVVIGMVHVLLPLMVLPLWASLQGIDRNLELAANTLGAGPWSTFWRITVPLSTSGIAAGSLIVFALTMSGYVTPLILGGPRAGYLMAALITGEATFNAELAYAATLGVLFLAVLIPFVWLHYRAEHFLGRYAR